MNRNYIFPKLRYVRLVLIVSLTIVSANHGSTFFGSQSKADFLVSDNSDHQVLRFRDDGTPFADPFIAPGAGGLTAPAGMVFDSSGNLLVTSTSQAGSQVLRFNGSTGQFIDVFASDLIDSPTHLGFLPGTDTLLVANRGTEFPGTSITAIDSNGSRRFTTGDDGFEPERVTSFLFGPDNFLYVSDLFGRINKYNADGTFDSEFQPRGTSAAGMLFDANGDLLVAKPDTFQIQKFSPAGIEDASFQLNTGMFNFPVFMMQSPLAGDDDLLVSITAFAGSPSGVYRFGVDGTAKGVFLALPAGNTSGEILYIPTAIPEPTMVLPFGIAIGYILMRRRRGTA